MANRLVSLDEGINLSKYDYVENVLVQTTTFTVKHFEIDLSNAYFVHIDLYLRIINHTNCANGFEFRMQTYESPAPPDSAFPLMMTYVVHTDPSTDVIEQKRIGANSQLTFATDLTAVTDVTIKIEGVLRLTNNKTFIAGVYDTTSGQYVTIKEGYLKVTPLGLD